MKIFVATAETQGERETDYTWTVEGELRGRLTAGGTLLSWVAQR